MNTEERVKNLIPTEHITVKELNQIEQLIKKNEMLHPPIEIINGEKSVFWNGRWKRWGKDN